MTRTTKKKITESKEDRDSRHLFKQLKKKEQKKLDKLEDKESDAKKRS